MNGDRGQEYDDRQRNCLRCRSLSICGPRAALIETMTRYIAIEVDDLARICRAFDLDPRKR